MKNVIEVKNLVAAYGNKIILDNVSVAIRQKEIFIILGSSGGGKTTLLKHIISLNRPVSGNIQLLGTDIHNTDENKRDKTLKEIGMLFQGGALLNSLKVWENIAIPLEQHTNYSREVIRNIVKQKLALVDLKHAFNLYPSELSGGMKKRVALARAIALEPKILFFDEPSAGLDPVTSRELDKLILKLKRQLGITLVIVTHELESIKRITDRFIFLVKGKEIFTGSIKEAQDASIPIINDFFGWK